MSSAQSSINNLHGSNSFNLGALLKDPTSPSLGRTDVAQPAIYTLSVLSQEIHVRKPSFMAGHSLGAQARRVDTLEAAAGAFHTSFMRDAAQSLEIFMDQTQFGKARDNINILSNLTGEVVSGQFDKKLLVEAMTNPVQWFKILGKLKTCGVRQIYEAGPGTSLTALSKSYLKFYDLKNIETANILD